MRPVWMIPRECDWHHRSGPTVYRLYNGARELIYVGMTDGYPDYRIHDHMQNKMWGGQIQHVALEHHWTSRDALAAEVAAIKAERPLHNLRSVPCGT